MSNTYRKLRTDAEPPSALAVERLERAGLVKVSTAYHWHP